MEAERGVINLQGRECQGLPPETGRKHWNDSPTEPPEGTCSADTLSLDFCLQNCERTDLCWLGHPVILWYLVTAGTGTHASEHWSWEPLIKTRTGWMLYQASPCARLSIRPDPCLGNTHSSFGHKGTRLHSWGRAGAEITCSLFGPQRTRSEVPKMESREFTGGEEVRAWQASGKRVKGAQRMARARWGWRPCEGACGKRGNCTEIEGMEMSQGLEVTDSPWYFLVSNLAFTTPSCSRFYSWVHPSPLRLLPGHGSCLVLVSCPLPALWIGLHFTQADQCPQRLQNDWTPGHGFGPSHGLDPFPLDARLGPILPSLLQAPPQPFHCTPVWPSYSWNKSF